ncbi:MAG: hypothetical protein J6P45_04540 [Lachnospiraceae bacterium]|nr:hypothetical protein [Lachnospiraceae bacterium]
MKKGGFGYIRFMRKRTFIHMLILFIIAFGIFFAGKIMYPDYSTMFSITAIVVCIPASMRTVSFIMFMIHKGADKELFDEISPLAGDIPLFYDSVITTAEKSYDVNVFALTHEQIIGYSPKKGKDLKKLEEHLKEMAFKNGFKSSNVKIFTDTGKFKMRLEKLSSDFKEKDESDDALYNLIGNLSL